MATKRKKVTRKSKSPTVRIAEISPCLWFDGKAEQAARFYVSVFKKAKITHITRYPGVGQEIHGGKAGSVMTVEWVLHGVKFLGLNGGPHFKFSEAISFQVLCDTQKEIDYYWEKLRRGGPVQAQQCGWLRDKFGLAWQVVPRGMEKMLKDPKSPKTERVFAAMMQMKKLDIAALEAAWKGKG